MDNGDETWQRIAAASAGLKRSLLARIPQPGLYSTAVPGLMLARKEAAGLCEHSVMQPSASLMIQGGKRIYYGSSYYEYWENQSMVRGMAMPSSSQLLEASPEKPLLIISFALNRQMIADLLVQLGRSEPLSSSVAGVSVANASPDFMESMLALCHALDKPADVLVRSEILLRDLHYLLLTGPHGPMLRYIHGSGRNLSQMFAAIEYMKTHLRTPVSMEEISRAVFMSESSLYRNFKTLTGLSPMRYYKQLRLYEARRLIIEEDDHAGIAAMKTGYESPQQFNRDYKKLFGQPPYQSKKRAG